MYKLSMGALVAVLTMAQSFELDPNGNTLAFDMHRRSHALQKRDNIVSASPTLTGTGSLYYVNITLGTPAQSMAVDIDTGSSDFWVPEINSTYCQAGCPLGGFDPKQSSSYNLTQPNGLSTSYRDGSTGSGDFGNDILQLGGVTLDGVTVGVVNNGSTNNTANGILGLGFRQLEASAMTHLNPTVLDTLVSTGKISTHTFSLYLNDLGAPGTLLFGGLDTAKFHGELGIIDLAPGLVEYIVGMSNLSFSTGGAASDPISLGNSSAVPALLDSGTTNTIVPDEVAYAIYRGLGLEYNSSMAYIACDAEVDGFTLNFTFSGGVEIGVPLSQFILPYEPSWNIPDIDGDRACQFGIEPWSNDAGNGGKITLGDSFLRGAYVVFDLDNRQVALAPAVPNAADSNVIAIVGSAPSAASSAAPSAAPSGTPTFPIVSNVIPSATTVPIGTASLSPLITSTLPPPTGAATPTSVSATFSGLPSGGLGILPSAKGAASHLRPPLEAAILIAAVLMAMGGLLLF